MHLALTRAWAAARARVRDERGFTLIELLVALATGMVVATATMALLIVTLHLTSNYTDRVDANQQGRLAMQRITQTLNSSCISPSIVPVRAGSGPNTLILNSAPLGNDAPLVTPNMVTVTENGTSVTPGSLVLTTQPPAGSTTNFTLLAWSAPTGTTPVFQYYGYAADDTPTALITGTGTGQTLTSSQALQVVMVTINFQALPSDNWSTQGRAADFSDSVVLRLTPASSAGSASNSPCSYS